MAGASVVDGGRVEAGGASTLRGLDLLSLPQLCQSNRSSAFLGSFARNGTMLQSGTQIVSAHNRFSHWPLGGSIAAEPESVQCDALSLL